MAEGMRVEEETEREDNESVYEEGGGEGGGREIMSFLMYSLVMSMGFRIYVSGVPRHSANQQLS